MEMEKINENTIRVSLGMDDLAERGVTILDLLNNHEQIETFFYSILEEVDKDHMFANNDAVTFQVMPSQEGLELLISKNAKPEDMDANASVFDLSQKGISHSNQRMTQFKSADNNEVDDTVIEFETFEDVIGLANSIQLIDTRTDLFAYQDHYYLLLTFGETLPAGTMQDELASAYEYGNKTSVTPEILSEYGKRIMSGDAIATTLKYFG